MSPDLAFGRLQHNRPVVNRVYAGILEINEGINKNGWIDISAIRNRLTEYWLDINQSVYRSDRKLISVTKELHIRLVNIVGQIQPRNPKFIPSAIVQLQSQFRGIRKVETVKYNWKM